MNMFDEARALQGTIHLCKITQEELAEKLGVSQSYVANKLRLLKFSDELQALLLEMGLSERHARTILRLPEDASRRLAIRRAGVEGLSVSMTEQLVDVLLLTERTGDAKGVRERAIAHLQHILADTVGVLSSVGVRAKRSTEETANELSITLSIAK